MSLEQARFNMIEQQIRPWNVVDEDVLRIMQEIPREFFVPHEYKELAFSDIEIPLEHDQQMMAPKIEAHMLQALDAGPGDRVLEVGTGSGYVTACLDWLCDDVTSIEIHEDMSHAAQARLSSFGIQDVNFIVGDVFTTDFGQQFDVIAVTGSLPVPTDVFEKKLAVGGRLFQVTGIGDAASAQRIVRVREDAFRREELFETALFPLINAEQPKEFVF